MKRIAAAVMTARTAAPRSRSRRISSRLLEAAIPPAMISRIRLPRSNRPSASPAASMRLCPGKREGRVWGMVRRAPRRYTSRARPRERQTMIVEQIWTANAGRNFNYLIACAETGEALAVDPLDHEKCLAAAKRRGWTITQILNTHEHRDHT